MTNLVKKNELQQDKPTYIGKNLRTILEAHGMGISKLAQTLGIPIMTIRRLLMNETTDPRISTLKLIADYFNIPVDSLIENTSQYNLKTLKKSAPHFVPILDWETVRKINSTDELDLSKWDNWQPVSLRKGDTLSNNAFAIESQHYMYPRFPQGTIFIIDPKASPADGDLVLLKIKENNELTLKELSIDPPDWVLKSVVSETNTFKYSKNQHTIIGVNLFTVFYKKKA